MNEATAAVYRIRRKKIRKSQKEVYSVMSGDSKVREKELSKLR